MRTFLQGVLRAATPVAMFAGCAAAQAGCSCDSIEPVRRPARELLACRTQTARRPVATRAAPEVESVSAGTIRGHFAVTGAGQGTYTMALRAVPGRAGVEPKLSLNYRSDGGDDGILGSGGSLGGLSSITRCPSTLADGGIRGVRYDAGDKLCLDTRPLLPVGEVEAGALELRTFPDTHVRVIAHLPPGGNTAAEALFFEAFDPSGMVVEYGASDDSRPLALGGAASAWLATGVRDGRLDTMAFAYCVAEDAEGYAAEVALDEIRYTSFEGTPALEPSRAVRFVYGTREPAERRRPFAGGMALQRSLRLDEIRMLGPGDTLVRRYGLTYEVNPATHRTLLTQVEECAGDGVCKPPARFQYSRGEVGFKRVATTIARPTSRLASPMLMDLDRDGYDEIVLPDTDRALSTPGNPSTAWRVAKNHGAGSGGATPYFEPLGLGFWQEGSVVVEPIGPSAPTGLQPELGTAIDYDQDGRTDILLHDVHDMQANFQVLLAQPDRTFVRRDTGIRRPFPVDGAPEPPSLTRRGAAAHLADVDGDRVPDLILCRDHSETAEGIPSDFAWTVHLWQPARSSAEEAGFARVAEPIERLAGFPCDVHFNPVDLDADGKIELVVTGIHSFGDGSKEIAATYWAVTRERSGSWELHDTKLRVVPPEGRVLFVDLSGDGLPDAVESGFADHALRTYFNTGKTFVAAPGSGYSLGSPGLGGQDTFFRLAAAIDANGDGRQDILMPVPPGTLPGGSEVLPAWAILEATSEHPEATFRPREAGIPFEVTVAEAITPADPRGPRVGDLNGDGAQDVILPIGGVFTVFENLAVDQDLLISVAGGMNAHDPTDEGFVPNVSVSYGHLSDRSVTEALSEGDPAWEQALYLARAGAANGCDYPRSCAVGPRRVVSGYALNNGADRPRRFAVRYRDGRYHRLGRGFLGFGQRVVTDLDTGAGTADLYDNVTFDQDLNDFPFAGQVKQHLRWAPGLASQPRPEQIEIAFIDVKHTVVPTNDGKSYFTLPTERRVRRAQGSLRGPVEAYVEQTERGRGARILRDSTTKVTDFDDFGHIEGEETSTAGVDLSYRVKRTFKNDTERWVLGQMETQEECSAAAGRPLCRTLTRTHTIYGEVETEAVDSDEDIPDTKLLVRYGRDTFGNVESVTAEDAFGHRRGSITTYDAEGIFPETEENAEGHITVLKFDPGLGVLIRETDPNGRVTEWKHDGFGRLGRLIRPEGSQTTITLSRSKDGGPKRDAWRVQQRTTTTGGAGDTVEVDSLNRPIRWLWHGPSTPRADGKAPPRLMQYVEYDALGEHVARRSVPASEGTPELELRFDGYQHDAAGRLVEHTTPWDAVETVEYDGLLVRATDAGGHVTVVEQDPLGRNVTITDAARGVTRYGYGPFGALDSVTDPGDAVTRTPRDALGRVRQRSDPDRGTTFLVHDGFGELVTSEDALGRTMTLERDGLGRVTSRLDQHGAERRTTTWTWDTAEHGIGQLHHLTTPEAKKTYSYAPRGLLETTTLELDGEREPLVATLGHDDFGRVETITYPVPSGAAPFVVEQERDAYGHVLAVRDLATQHVYWQLTDVDDAGRFRTEQFGNDVLTERSYYGDKQRPERFVTRGAMGTVQDLSFEYDERLDLKRRTDALQPNHRTERFRHDPLHRLTCAYFSPVESASTPCASSYGYAPDGNLTFKSDVGTLVYDDPLHKHAVTGAGGDRFAHDAVGNQITRPNGATVRYTPFDLPATVTRGAETVAFTYDGDQQRIRKTTPESETLYFEALYERVTRLATGATEHRYHVDSPERVVAVVTRGGAGPGTRYLHVDHLGSVDALTGEQGAVVERRSYDPFGQRRNPIWSAPVPASFASGTTWGFTGHESDDDLGLVNMKGRLYDPRLGRFLTTDPLIALPDFGQSYNAYSYVLNSPLNFVDPTGFQPAYQAPPVDPEYAEDPQSQQSGVA